MQYLPMHSLSITVNLSRLTKANERKFSSGGVFWGFAAGRGKAAVYKRTADATVRMQACKPQSDRSSSSSHGFGKPADDEPTEPSPAFQWDYFGGMSMTL